MVETLPCVFHSTPYCRHCGGTGQLTIAPFIPKQVSPLSRLRRGVVGRFLVSSSLALGIGLVWAVAWLTDAEQPHGFFGVSDNALTVLFTGWVLLAGGALLVGLWLTQPESTTCAHTAHLDSPSPTSEGPLS